MPRSTAKTDARTKLLEAALSVIRTKGYSATSVDELCAAAGVTKGAFFHHFKSKDELGVAAADRWSETTGALFADAPYHDHAAPLDRVLGYLEFAQGPSAGRRAGVHLSCRHHGARRLTRPRLPSAKPANAASQATPQRWKPISKRRCETEHGPDWTAKSLALHTQAVIQGAFILAKATGGAEIAADSIDHLRRCIEMLFGVGTKQAKHLTDGDSK